MKHILTMIAGVTLAVSSFAQMYSKPTFEQVERLIVAERERNGEVVTSATSSGMYSSPTYGQVERLIGVVKEGQGGAGTNAITDVKVDGVSVVSDHVANINGLASTDYVNSYTNQAPDYASVSNSAMHAVQYVADKEKAFTAVTIGTRHSTNTVGPQSLSVGVKNTVGNTLPGLTPDGGQSVAIGSENTVKGKNSIAVGESCGATAQDTVALGKRANANSKFQYTWNGVDDVSYYGGAPAGDARIGTYNINPVGGTSGFYIGTNNLTSILGSITPSGSRYISVWDCSRGVPMYDIPNTEYKVGDVYIVGVTTNVVAPSGMTYEHALNISGRGNEGYYVNAQFVFTNAVASGYIEHAALSQAMKDAGITGKTENAAPATGDAYVYNAETGEETHRDIKYVGTNSDGSGVVVIDEDHTGIVYTTNLTAIADSVTRVGGNPGSNNYRPDGTSYTKGAVSTAVEPETVFVNDTYWYDGSSWILLSRTNVTIDVSSITNGLASTNYVNAAVAAIPPADLPISNVVGSLTMLVDWQVSGDDTRNIVFSSKKTNETAYVTAGTVNFHTRSLSSGSGTVSGSNSFAANTAAAKGVRTVAFGNASEAKAEDSTAMGRYSRTDSKRSFAWSGAESSSKENKYYDNGVGTFNINPEGGVDGFYIGTNNLTSILGGITNGLATTNYVNDAIGRIHVTTDRITDGTNTITATGKMITPVTSNGVIVASVTNILATESHVWDKIAKEVIYLWSPDRTTATDALGNLHNTEFAIGGRWVLSKPDQSEAIYTFQKQTADNVFSWTNGASYINYASTDGRLRFSNLAEFYVTPGLNPLQYDDIPGQWILDGKGTFSFSKQSSEPADVYNRFATTNELVAAVTDSTNGLATVAYVDGKKTTKVWDADNGYFHNATGELYRMEKETGGHWVRKYETFEETYNYNLDKSSTQCRTWTRTDGRVDMYYYPGNGNFQVGGSVVTQIQQGLNPLDDATRFPVVQEGNWTWTFTPQSSTPALAPYDRFATTNELVQAIASVPATHYISPWDCSTGKPAVTMPDRTYKAGDTYVVSGVATGSDPIYKHSIVVSGLTYSSPANVYTNVTYYFTNDVGTAYTDLASLVVAMRAVGIVGKGAGEGYAQATGTVKLTDNDIAIDAVCAFTTDPVLVMLRRSETTGMEEEVAEAETAELLTDTVTVFPAPGTVNYRPSGSVYTNGVASTVEETGAVHVNDTYWYNGTAWELICSAIPQVTSVNGKTGDVTIVEGPTTYVKSFNGQSGDIAYVAPVTSVNGEVGAVQTVAFRPFPQNILTNENIQTMEEFGHLLAENNPPVGSAFLGGIEYAPMPAGIGNCEVEITVPIEGIFTYKVTSTTTQPWQWEATGGDNSFSGWRQVLTIAEPQSAGQYIVTLTVDDPNQEQRLEWKKIENVPTSNSTNVLKAVYIDGTITYKWVAE